MHTIIKGTSKLKLSDEDLQIMSDALSKVVSTDVAQANKSWEIATRIKEFLGLPKSWE